MTPKQEEYRRRKAEQEAKYKHKFLERWFGWWRNPPDRFAAMIAIFTAGLFVATYGLWDATKDLVEDARDSGRAWLSPKNGILTDQFAEGHPIKLRIDYVNTGRSPALDVRTVYRIGAIETSHFTDDSIRTIVENDNICRDVGIAEGAETIFPDSAGNSMHFELPADWGGTKTIAAKTHTLVVEVCFAYKTVERVRRTAFCYFWRPDSGQPQQLNVCPAGNHAS
jgi:hypothetical protein